MARRLGAVKPRRKGGGAASPARRRWLAIALAVAAGAALAWFLVLPRGETEPRVVLPQATATIGSGSDAIAVGPDGTILAWLPLSEELQLPQLPLAAAPEGERLRGPALEQARVLGAAPAALRPYIAGSYYGESGVDVELRSGGELRFGDASQAVAKWRTAAAVLADPSITAFDYVNLHVPRRPAVHGSTHTLPTLP